MAWSDTRDALVGVLEALGYTVYKVAPLRLTIRDRIVVMLMPPARTTDRRHGATKQKTYLQRLTVMHGLGQASEDVIGDKVDAAVEAIDDALDLQVALGGEAVTVTPGVWEECELVDYPAGTQIYYVAMSGIITVTVQHEVTFAAG